MKTQKHCEICGVSVSKKEYRYFAKVELIIYLKSPHVVHIDERSKTVTISNGDKYSYHIIEDDEAYIISKVSPHIVCSEKCAERFLEVESTEIVTSLNNNNYPCYNPALTQAFLPIMFHPENIEHCEDTCEYCGELYPSRSVDFLCIPLIDVATRKGVYPPKEEDLIQGYHSLMSDTHPNKPGGTFYNIKLDLNKGNWHKNKFCSNECAYEFCVENRTIAQTKSNMLKNHNVLITPFIKELNIQLKNRYLYRPFKTS
ncbi:MAG: hypothetical protein PHY48_11395 [Candidatus Cloacimonetes bacterium]|jgi:hypothetical protein|nr:hypothetical protein [Candidatus Cloacimonadota bacterium]